MRLERRAEHRHPLADERAAELLAGQVDHARAPAHVDRVDLAQERQRLVGAELPRPRHERADVLRQAATAEPETGVEEPAADARVVVPAPRPSWVTSAPVASHTSAIALMNEILVARNALAATLTSSAVAKSVTTWARPRRAVGVDLAQRGLGLRGPHAEHEPVGAQRVLDGEALAQELRVPGQLDAGPAGAARRAARPAGPPCRPARWTCRRSGSGRSSMRRRARRSPRRRRSGRRRSSPLRCGVPTQTKWTSPNSAASAVRGGEPQPTRRHLPWPAARRDRARRTGSRPLGRSGDLVRVDVDAEHVVTELGHARGVGGAEVAGADDGEAEGHAGGVTGTGQPAGTCGDRVGGEGVNTPACQWRHNGAILAP